MLCLLPYFCRMNGVGENSSGNIDLDYSTHEDE